MLADFTPVLSVFGGLLGAYLGSYMKKKGENLALQDDLAQLVKQAEATTVATKAIESKISGDLWGRQKHWEMKRDALVGALQALELADDALLAMSIHFQAGRHEDDETRAARLKQVHIWRDAMNAFDNSRVLVRLVCEPKSVSALLRTSKSIRSSASKILKREVLGYDEVAVEVQKHIQKAFVTARREIGVDAHDLSLNDYRQT